MGQICPSGRKIDYASFRDGAARTSCLARTASECFLRGVPGSHPHRKCYQMEF